MPRFRLASLNVVVRRANTFVATAIAAAFAAIGIGVGQADAATAYPGGIWEPGPARYGVENLDNVTMKLKDGVVLRARVAYPTDLATGKRAEGKFPVILEFSQVTDTQVGGPLAPPKFLTERGYITAVVAPRAGAGSQGQMQFYSAQEGRDGKEVIEWASRLEGSNGKVGMFGCSYSASLALTAAAKAGPNSPLKAVVPACIGLSGIQRQSFLVGGLPTTGVRLSTRIAGSLASDSAGQFFNNLISDIQSGGEAAYDRTFWRDRIPLSSAKPIADAGIAVLLWSGWRDYFEIGALRSYAAFQNTWAKRPLYAPMDPNQPVSPRFQIIIDNLPHGDYVDIGIIQQWMDTWLKDIDTGIGKTKTPMHIYEGGADRWVNLSHYPTVARYSSFYLGGENELKDAKSTTSGHAELNWGAPDQSGSKVSFTTATLQQGATLSGPISATVYASSSNTNLVMIAKLYEVTSGAPVLISKGAVVGSLRTLDREMSWTDDQGAVIEPWPALKKDEYLTPGQTYRFDIALAPRQWAVAPGHRLRLELTTQNSAEICSVRGTDPCGLTKPQQDTVPGGKYKILFGPDAPSALNLPVLPYQDAPTVRAGFLPTRMRGRNDVGPGIATLPLDW